MANDVTGAAKRGPALLAGLAPLPSMRPHAFSRLQRTRAVSRYECRSSNIARGADK